MHLTAASRLSMRFSFASVLVRLYRPGSILKTLWRINTVEKLKWATSSPFKPCSWFKYIRLLMLNIWYSQYVKLIRKQTAIKWAIIKHLPPTRACSTYFFSSAGFDQGWKAINLNKTLHIIHYTKTTLMKS